MKLIVSNRIPMCGGPASSGAIIREASHRSRQISDTFTPLSPADGGLTVGRMPPRISEGRTP